jgi:hypothetical protein
VLSAFLAHPLFCYYDNKMIKATSFKAIKPPMPTKEYNQYMKDAGVASEDALTQVHVKKIIANAVDGFLRGDLSTDGLSMICNRLFRVVTKLPGDDQQLLDVVIAGSELSFYVRQPKLLPQFNSFLRKVLEYREHLLTTI